MLVEAFKEAIFPYITQLAVILLVLSIARSGYSLFRKPDWQQFLDKFKAAIIAYAVVRGSFAIVSFIDKIINSMNLPLK